MAGRLFVVSGPAGTGKGTIIAKVREARPNLALSVSATTRGPREGEVHGTHYYFMSREEFLDRVERGEFLEWADVHGNLYGTLLSEVERKIDGGASLILEIDTQGAANVRKMAPKAVTVFIMPPDLDTLRQRLIGRGSETPETLARRLADAEEEIEHADEYDEIVVSNELECSVPRMLEIIDRYEAQEDAGIVVD